MKNLGITERVLRAGGLIAGDGGIEYARTLAFHTLVLFSLFAVFAARSDEVSAFRDFFTNGWLWLAVAGSLALQLAVLYLPSLQRAFNTVPLHVGELGDRRGRGFERAVGTRSRETSAAGPLGAGACARDLISSGVGPGVGRRA
jgi:hypothetical protein